MLLATSWPGTARAAIGPRLAWAPWSKPGAVRINVPTTGLDVVLPDTQDTILVWPNVPVTPKPGAGCVRIQGGRDLKSIGGECSIPYQGATYDSKTRRCMSITAGAANRLVHIEGFHCTGDVLDGLEFYSPSATLTVERSRFDGITARDEVNFTDGHPDGIYLSAGGATPGAKAVRIDRVTVVSDYQAFFFGHPTTGVGQNYPIDLRNSNGRGTPIPGTHLPQLLWRADALNKLTLTNFYLQPQVLGDGSSEPLIKTVKPSDVDPVAANRSSYKAGGTVGWPAAANVFGVARPGSATDVDFCPVGCAGINYVPGGPLTLGGRMAPTSRRRASPSRQARLFHTRDRCTRTVFGGRWYSLSRGCSPTSMSRQSVR